MGSRGSDFKDDAKALSKKVEEQMNNWLINKKSDGSYYSWDETVEKVIPDIHNLAKIANEEVDFKITKSNSDKLGNLLRRIVDKTGYGLGISAPAKPKDADSGIKKNISLKNLFGGNKGKKNEADSEKVNIEKKGDSIKLSNGKDSVSMKLEIHESEGDFHYFEPTKAFYSSSNPEKAAKMYASANKGFSYRKGADGTFEILTSKGDVDFVIGK